MPQGHDLVPSLACKNGVTFGDHQTGRGSIHTYLWVGLRSKLEEDSILGRKANEITPTDETSSDDNSLSR